MTERKGYLTDGGAVVRKTKAPLDPGHRRSGARLSLGDELIIGTVYQSDGGTWFVEGYLQGTRAYRVWGATRGDAVDRYLRQYRAERRSR